MTAIHKVNTTTKSKAKTRPNSRSAAKTKPVPKAPHLITAARYRALSREEQSRVLTKREIDSLCEFQYVAALDLLHGDKVRHTYAGIALEGAPLVCQLADVRDAWEAASSKCQPNVAVVRDHWKVLNTDEGCSVCQCDSFLEMVLEAVAIEKRAGLIVVDFTGGAEMMDVGPIKRTDLN